MLGLESLGFDADAPTALQPSPSSLAPTRTLLRMYNPVGYHAIGRGRRFDRGYRRQTHLGKTTTLRLPQRIPKTRAKGRFTNLKDLIGGRAAGQGARLGCRVDHEQVQTSREDEMVKYRVVSADSHVVEPPDLWELHIDPQFRERSPGWAMSVSGKPL